MWHLQIITPDYSSFSCKPTSQYGQNLSECLTTVDVEQAIEAIRSGRSVGEAVRFFNIPRRTLRDWLDKSDSKKPIRKLDRNPVLNCDVESQLKQRIVRLQQVGLL